MFRKAHPRTPAAVFAWEASGLSWLRVEGGAPVVPVLEVGDDHLDLVRLETVTPTRQAAHAFGAALAVTHDAGVTAYGAAPDGWSGDGFWGPLGDALPLMVGSWTRWGAFYVEARLDPMLRRCRDQGIYDDAQAGDFASLHSLLLDGRFDTDDQPARLHGDLWSGNVMWTPDGAMLIDPAAHGGHRENDLALLALFGLPHLGEVLAGYQEAHPLADGWQERVGLHQLHCLLVHALLFGGGYADRALTIARRLSASGG